MRIRNDSEFGYVELDPNLNEYYDMETDEKIYEPSDYPFNIPKVYLEGCRSAFEPVAEDSIITVRDSIVTVYNYGRYWDKYTIEVYNLDTSEKRIYCVTPGSSSRMEMLDYYRLIDYIDPNLIKRINLKEGTPNPSN